MAERKSQNKYYPPDWDPIYGSINRMVKSKKPMKRPRLEDGVPREYGRKVRFEMPFSIWCLGCENHIGMGVRYNALRTEVGKYLSTIIQCFRMKCHLCPNYFEIHTDPKNTSYKIVSGCRQRIETFDPKDAGVILLPEKEETERLNSDAFYRLEHNLKDVEKGKDAAATINEIQKYNHQVAKDQFQTSRLLRQKFRIEKQAKLAIEKNSNAVRDKMSLSIDVVPENEQDQEMAGSIRWKETFIDSDAGQKKVIADSAIFPTRPKLKKTKTLSKDILKAAIAKSKKGDPFAINL